LAEQVLLSFDVHLPCDDRMPQAMIPQSPDLIREHHPRMVSSTAQAAAKREGPFDREQISFA
jgi:hypothetical protein